MKTTDVRTTREMTENEAACIKNSIDALRKGSRVAAYGGSTFFILLVLGFVIYDIIAFGFSIRDVFLLLFSLIAGFVLFKIAMVTGKHHFIQKPLHLIEGKLHIEITTFTRFVVCRIESTRLAFPRQWKDKIDDLIGKVCKCWYYTNESGHNMVVSVETDEIELSLDADVKSGVIDPMKFYF